MNRLTEYVDGEARHVQVAKIGYKDCLRKLASYEDTKLDPDEIQQILKDNAKIILDLANVKETDGRLLAENEMLRDLVKEALYTLKNIVPKGLPTVKCQTCGSKAVTTQAGSYDGTVIAKCPKCGFASTDVSLQESLEERDKGLEGRRLIRKLERQLSPSGENKDKHGYWFGCLSSTCSECNYRLPRDCEEWYEYCPNCGAIMDVDDPYEEWWEYQYET
jgi:predicted RNA-binding Zn-ribbon protein involved in translation (DUF1610 family)